MTMLYKSVTAFAIATASAQKVRRRPHAHARIRALGPSALSPT